MSCIPLHFDQVPEPAQSSEPQLAADLSLLNGLFSAEELNLYGEEPIDGSFPACVASSTFWERNPQDAAQLGYRPAVQRYLRTCLGQNSVFAFGEYMRIWAGSFYATRRDRKSARDVLLGFLYQNLEILRHLYLLSLPYNHDLAPTDAALNACFHAPENEQSFIGTAFSTWVLKDWLPCHLRHYHDLHTEIQADVSVIEEQDDASVFSKTIMVTHRH